MTDNSHDTHAHPVSDRGAAITGFILGAIVIFLILTTIVKLTNAHYRHEKPAATATQ